MGKLIEGKGVTGGLTGRCVNGGDDKRIGLGIWMLGLSGNLEELLLNVR